MTPLRRLIARHQLGIQLPIVAILLGLVWWGTRSLLLDLGHRDGEARLRVAVQALDQRLGEVERAGRFIYSYWEQGWLPFEDAPAGAALLSPWLTSQDQILVLNFVDEQGLSMLFMRTREGWQARLIQKRRGDGEKVLGWSRLDAHGLVPSAAEPHPLRGYDPRQRGWYQEARQLEEARWSTPYRLDPPESRLVLTWLVPLRDGAARTVGAMGLDLLPGDLQSFLDLLRPTPGSRLWVLDQEGVVVASAQGALSELPVPVARDRAVLGGMAHRVVRAEVPRHPGTQWRMVLAIPERDLLATAQGRLLGLTALASLLLMVPILWGLRVGRQLSRSVQGLAEAAEHLGAGETPALPATDIQEFHTLGQALRRAQSEIEEKSRLEQRLQHSQRLETLGTLAGGIAHDVNNHLGAILGQLFLARESLMEGHPACQRLLHAEEAASRCARTTKSLLTFSRQGPPDLVRMDLHELLRTEAELLGRLLGGLVRVDLDLEPGSLTILGDRLQMEQVIMNLAVNARDAMPNGGTLFLRTRRSPSGSVVLTLRDTGTGIPPEAVSRIFEPFFTTKPVGKGTGLGLSMVFGIVQAHGGRIEVESVQGEGTVFTLTFPAEAAEAPPAAQAGLAREPMGLLAGLRILVVEDEAYLLETLEDALALAGASAAGATSGEVAWQLFKGGTFDCVLSDQRMPGCTGIELLRRIRSGGSRVPFILASGQDLSPYRAELEADPGVRILPKPFTIAALVKLVRGFGPR